MCRGRRKQEGRRKVGVGRKSREWEGVGEE